MRQFALSLFTLRWLLKKVPMLGPFIAFLYETFIVCFFSSVLFQFRFVSVQLKKREFFIAISKDYQMFYFFQQKLISTMNLFGTFSLKQLRRALG